MLATMTEVMQSLLVPPSISNLIDQRNCREEKRCNTGIDNIIGETKEKQQQEPKSIGTKVQ